MSNSIRNLTAKRLRAAKKSWLVVDGTCYDMQGTLCRIVAIRGGTVNIKNAVTGANQRNVSFTSLRSELEFAAKNSALNGM